MSIDAYIQARSADERVRLLTRLHAAGSTLPLALVRDLMLLELSTRERLQILKMSDRSDSSALEALLVLGLAQWKPDVASASLKLWETATPRARAAEIRTLLARPDTSPPALFAMVDAAWSLGGAAALDALRERRPWRDAPTETRSVFLRRATQLGFEDEDLLNAAERMILRGARELPFALEYVGRFRPAQLGNLLASPAVPAVWQDLIRSVHQVAPHDVEAALAAPVKDPVAYYSDLLAAWPPVWRRAALGPASIAAALARVEELPPPRGLGGEAAFGWAFFAGIPADTLAAAVALLPPDLTPRAEARLGALLRAVPSSEARASAVVKGDEARHALVLLLTSGGAPSRRVRDDTSPWGRALLAATAPSGPTAAAVVDAGKCLHGIFLPLYFRMIGRGRGRNELIPRLIDYLGTNDPTELSALIDALDGIDTTQARGYLVKLLERLDAPAAVRSEICDRLREHDLRPFRVELEGVAKRHADERPRWTAQDRELHEDLATLLAVVLPPAEAPTPSQTTDGERTVERLFSGYGRYPDDVRNSLRTAQFILDAIKQAPPRERLDVSSCVVLQYTAVEQLCRSLLQDRILRAVGSQVLQRRLAALGYGSGGSNLSDEIERYLAALPVVRDIPGYNSFKLRKLLTTIAAFRPGKRFSLDGLKAYALFLLAFGRNECPFGLGGTFPLRVSDETTLLSFVRDAHVMHDIRNQAAHDGLPVKELKAVEALWHLTRSLLEAASAMA